MNTVGMKNFVRKPTVWGAVAAGVLIAAGTVWLIRQRSHREMTAAEEIEPEALTPEV